QVSSQAVAEHFPGSNDLQLAFPAPKENAGIDSAESGKARLLSAGRADLATPALNECAAVDFVELIAKPLRL
ncbi:hypothetical protein, partial [Pseudomonas syringae]